MGLTQYSVTDDGGDGQSGTLINKSLLFDPLNTDNAKLDTFLGGDNIDNASLTRSIILTAAGGSPTTTSGCASLGQRELPTNDVDILHLAFDKDTKEYAFWNFVMPDQYDGGTMTAIFYWTTPATTGDVIWGIQGLAFANDDPLEAAYGTAQEVTDTFILADDVHITAATSAITLAGGPAGGELVIIRVYRDAADGSDTLDDDAQLLAVKIEYTTNGISD